ncbi:MAG: UvrD-helicase domain-containing protein, partial [bacterium]
MSKEALTGFIDDFTAHTGFTRIQVPDRGFYHYREDGRGSLAPAEPGLERLLERFQLPQEGYRPLVSLETDGTTRLAWNIHWLREESKVLAIPKESSCLVLAEGGHQSLPLLSFHALDSPLLVGELHYVVRGPEISSKSPAFVPTGGMAALEDLVGHQEFQSQLLASRESREVTRALGALAFPFLQKNGWSATEDSLLSRLPEEFSGFLRWALLLALPAVPEEQLRSAWNQIPNRPLIGDLVPEIAELWTREEVALNNVANWLRGSQVDPQQFVCRVQAGHQEATTAAVEGALSDLPAEARTPAAVIAALGAIPSIDHTQEDLETKGWDHLEQFVFDRIGEPSADRLRKDLLQAMDERALREAWTHIPNRPFLQELEPLRLKQWQAETVRKIIKELDPVTVALGCDRTGRRMIQAWDQRGTEVGWPGNLAQVIEPLFTRFTVTLLVGYGLIKEIPHVARALQRASQPLVPYVDTRLLESIIRLSGSQSSSYGVLPQPDPNHRTLLYHQIIDLACTPEERLRHWLSLADPGLRRLLELIIQSREMLVAPCSEVRKQPGAPVKRSTSVGKDFPLEHLDELLRAPSEGERSLVVLPRQLIPLCGKGRSIDILDPSGRYILERDPVDGSHQEVHRHVLGDLRVFASAFVQMCRDQERSPHEACADGWVLALMQRFSTLRAQISQPYAKARKELMHADAALTVVPADALEDQSVRQYIGTEDFDRGLLVSPDTTVRDITESIEVEAKNWWGSLSLPSGSERVIGLDSRSAENLEVTWPDMKRGWLVGGPEGGWRVDVCPDEVIRFSETLFPNIPLTTLKAGPSSRWIHVADVSALREQASEQDWPLTPLTPYRNAYLGQIAGFIAPLLPGSRILLILNGRQDARQLYAALLALGLYTPSQRELTPMEQFAIEDESLVIGDEGQVLGWALQAKAYGLKRAFDLVILDAWPIDIPEQLSPLSREALRTVRFADPEQAEAPSEREDAVSFDADEVSRADQAALLAGETQVLSWREIWRTRLIDNSLLLDSYVWAAERLSGERLLVLDSRLPPGMIEEVGQYTIHRKSVAFDHNVASQVRDLLSQEPNRIKPRPPGGNVPERQDWDDWASNLFDLPGSLYPWQKQYMGTILPQRDKVVAVQEPTGSGKSLVFQLPALIHAASSNLLTVVISPLKALMQEQCGKLWRLGFSFSVEAISSDLSSDQVDEVYERLIDGQVKLLFVAPERFRSRRFRQALDARLGKDGRVQYWVFDEAHCVSLWGHEFRPDYLYAAEEVQHLRIESEGVAPVILLSATFPDVVLGELQDIFATEPRQPGAVRPILRDEIEVTAERLGGREAKEERLLKLLGKVNPEVSRALVFVTSRRLAEELSEFVMSRTDLSAAPFHAGLPESTRSESYEQFRSGDLTVLCATKAFGMGMDIDNIHLVVHFGPPSSLEDYIQEIGRTARDRRCLKEAGLDQATACLLYEHDDFDWMRTRVKDAFLSRHAIQELHNLLVDEWEKVGAPSNRFMTVQLWDLAYRHSGLDTSNEVRLGLYWLRRFQRVEVGYYTPAQVEVKVILEDTEIPGELSPKSQELLSYIRDKASGSRLVRFSARWAKEQLELRTRNRLFTLLAELARYGSVHFKRKLRLPMDEHRGQETRFGLSSGSWPFLDAVLAAIEEIHEDFEWDAEQQYSSKELEKRFKAVAENHLKPEHYGWLPPSQRDDAAQRERRLFRHHVSTVLALLRRLQIVRVGEEMTDEGITITLKGYREEWLAWFEAIPILVRAVLQNIVEQEGATDEGRREAGEIDGERLLLAAQAAVQHTGDEADPPRTIPLSISHVEAVLQFLRDLGYLRRYDRYVPMALEIKVEDASPIDIEETGPGEQVWDAFEKQKELRLLRLAALEAVPELSDRVALGDFVDRYFQSSSPQALSSLLQEALSTSSEILRRLREDALEEFIEGLSKKQQRKVYDAELSQHIMVLAGPGAGKTHTLLARLMRVVHDEDVRADRILVLAFTRAVVTELRHRVRTLLGELGYAALAQDIRVTTFHSFVMGTLREFNQIDSSVRFGDVDDWFVEFELHLRENPALRRHVADSYRFVFVDEFQDVHGARYRLLEYLADGRETHLFVVGDDDQSIYDYDRANDAEDELDYFDDFVQRFRPEIFELTFNYRSAKRIVSFSQQLLKPLPDRLKEQRLESNRSAEGVAEWRHVSANELTALVREAEQALENQETSRPKRNTVAILARTNADVYRTRETLQRSKLRDRFSILVQGQESRFIDRRDVAEALDRLGADGQDQSLSEHQLLDLLEQCFTTPPFEHWLCRESECKHELHHLAEEFFEESPTGVTASAFADYVREMSRDGNYLRVVAERQAKRGTGGQIILSTIHKVKGIEFPAVILLDSDMPVEDVDLELRVIYVGMTRAEDILFAIRSEREECLLAHRSFEPPVQQEDCIVVEPNLSDVFISKFGYDWQVQQLIFEKVARGDKITVVRNQGSHNPFSIRHDPTGEYIGLLAGVRAQNSRLSRKLLRRFPQNRRFTGLEVTGVYRRYAD